MTQRPELKKRRKYLLSVYIKDWQRAKYLIINYKYNVLVMNANAYISSSSHGLEEDSV